MKEVGYRQILYFLEVSLERDSVALSQVTLRQKDFHDLHRRKMP